MSDSPAKHSGRVRRSEEEEDHRETTDVVPQPTHEAVGAAVGSIQADPSATADQPPPPPPSICVTPLPQQFSQRKRLRRSARLACHLDRLAMVELQLVLQFLDTTSRLIAARCSRSLLQAASAPFAWKDAPPFVGEVQSPADVERICSSLLRLALIGLRCVGMESLQCVTTVPQLVGLELIKAPPSSAADLPQLLQHPSLAGLRTMRLDEDASKLLAIDTMRLIARLSQLSAFDMFLHEEDEDSAALKPLADAPALTDLTLRWAAWAMANATVLSAISGCTKLRRLSLHRLQFLTGQFIALCSSPNMRRLQHLELNGFIVAGVLFDDIESPDADEYRAGFSALQQLQSLTLEKVYGVGALLLHLHHVPPLRLLSIRCEPTLIGIDAACCPLPSRAVLSALLSAAPQLEARLLMPATLERWLALGRSFFGNNRDKFKQQRHELQRLGLELERVTVVIVDEDPPSA